MGMFDFLKDAGEKLSHPHRSDVEDDRAKTEALASQIERLGLKVEGLRLDYDDGVVTLRGTTPSQQEREKIVLLLGNTQGVARVNDQLVVEVDEPEARFYTVKKGDTLSAIAKAQYGNAMKYPLIFEANRPMLEDPDRIYPGQVLRIPPLEG